MKKSEVNIGGIKLREGAIGEDDLESATGTIKDPNCGKIYEFIIHQNKDRKSEDSNYLMFLLEDEKESRQIGELWLEEQPVKH